MADTRRRLAGIDLGTTHGAIAIYDAGGDPRLIANADGVRRTPTSLLIRRGAPIFGEAAREALAVSPDRVVRHLRPSLADAAWRREADGTAYDAIALSAVMLCSLLAEAEDVTGGDPVTDVVVTVPGCYDEDDRRAAIAVGQLAGVNVLGVIDEPTAVALAWACQRRDKKRRLLLIDAGGGKVDVSVAEIDADRLQIMASVGERTGGRDWDERVLDWARERLRAQHGIDPGDDPVTLGELRLEVERAKEVLSRRARVNLPCRAGDKGAWLTLTRETLAEIVEPHLDEVDDLVRRVLEMTGLDTGGIDATVATGGLSRSPALRRILKKRVGRAFEKVPRFDEGVAVGASLWAAVKVLQFSTEDRSELAAPIIHAVPESLARRLRGLKVVPLIKPGGSSRSDSDYFGEDRERLRRTQLDALLTADTPPSDDAAESEAAATAVPAPIDVQRSFTQVDRELFDAVAETIGDDSTGDDSGVFVIEAKRAVSDRFPGPVSVSESGSISSLAPKVSFLTSKARSEDGSDRLPPRVGPGGHDSCALAIDCGDHALAAPMIAAGLADDAESDRWLSLLVRLVAQNPSVIDLFAADPAADPASAAVHAYILAASGDVAGALALILEVQRLRPCAGYIAWARSWIAEPGAARAVDPERVGRVVDACRGADCPAEVLAGILSLIERVRAAQPAASDLARKHVQLLQELGG